MSNEITRRGLMLVLSSPSGAGKSTLSRRLLDVDRDLGLSISATTRPKRPGEVEGRDYCFLSPAEFERSVIFDEFLEYANVFEHRYGTPKRPVMEGLAKGKDVLFDIDWQGTQQLKEKMRDDLVTVFILPPSHNELERRLRARAQDSDETIAKRMAKAAEEISHWPEYDYVIVNHDIEQALIEIKAILTAERLRRTRQIGISSFVAGLA